jgi:hypothetical protein
VVTRILLLIRAAHCVGGVSSYFGIFSLDFVVWYRTLGRQPTTKIRFVVASCCCTQHDVVDAELMTTTPKPQFFNVLKVGDLINTLILLEECDSINVNRRASTKTSRYSDNVNLFARRLSRVPKTSPDTVDRWAGDVFDTWMILLAVVMIC